MNVLTKLSGYQIVEELYRGPRTLVYRGMRIGDQQPVVIKILRNEYPNFNEIIQFRNQYTIAKNLDFSHIVKPLALEVYHNSYALVMEDFGGISLSIYLKIGNNESQINQYLPLVDFLEIAIKLTETLHYLYQNRVIHKDIKPANILINPESKEIKLIDFSISSLLPKETQEIQNLNILEGTLAYISPEQTGRMNRGIDYRSDFYSLGVTFYELLTGKAPFQSEDAMELVHCHLAKQAIPIHQINPEIPLILSEIVGKLMQKNAEDRYQSALGIRHDLETCLTQLQRTGKIENFALGKRDISDHFTIHEKLYGREQEVHQLLAAFERVSTNSTEMMLVAGFSGIGKTAVVNEVHKPIVRQRGYFIKGKYDQFQRNIPFSAFVQAFRDLIGQLLSESDAQIQTWRSKILEAVGDNGQVLIDVIPELEKIIGHQPPATELSGNAAQNRFNLLFHKFVKIFTSQEHPLVMFLDDLQWADSASLNLLKLLMQDTGYLLILGAYRNNEVSPVHSFILTVDDLIKNGAEVNTIILPPLTQIDMNQLVADTLNCELSMAQPLTKLVYQKTQGNPFFATQFLKALYDDKLISFDWDIQHWQCDIAQIKALAITDDVVEFMALQLQKLPIETQDVLKLAACIGAEFDLSTLAIVSEKSAGVAATALWKALQEGLVIPKTKSYKFFTELDSKYVLNAAANSTYRFLHDRIQQAAYSLIPELEKQATHYHIGKLLLNNFLAAEREERLFEIVTHLNLGRRLIDRDLKPEELVQLNLMAGIKAKAATAYTAAVQYLTTGIELLAVDSWQTHYQLTLELYIAAAESAYLSTKFEQVETLAQIVLKETHKLSDQIKIYEIKIQIFISQNKLTEAIELGLNVLDLLGINFPPQPNQSDIINELQKTQLLWNEIKVSEVFDLPLMDDRDKLAAMQILLNISAASYIAQPPLYLLIVFQQVNLSVKYGNTAASTYSYAAYGLILCGVVGDIALGYQFGQIALKLLEKLNAKELQAKIYVLVNSFIQHWHDHLRTTIQPLQESYLIGLEIGDLEFAAYSASQKTIHLYFTGEDLDNLEQNIELFIEAVIKIKRSNVVNYYQVLQQVVSQLKDIKKADKNLPENRVILELPEDTQDPNGICYFYCHKMILCYLFDEKSEAMVNTNIAKKYSEAMTALFFMTIFYFYDSLIHLAVYVDVTLAEQENILAQVTVNQEKMKNWADNAPMNHLHKFDLVEAEKYRVIGNKTEAIDFYDRAIAGAKTNRYLQEEALANELAAKFYLNWGKEKVAAGYMQEAYYCYTRWGAKAKVIDLEKRYPQLLTPILQQFDAADSFRDTIARGTMVPTKNSTSISEVLDLAALFKVSQAISGKIELDKLLTTLLAIVIANAGASKCILLLKQDIELKVVALVEEGNLPQSLPAISLESREDIAISLVNTVKRTLKSLVLFDATVDTQFANDIYIQKHQPRSILCIPILNQGKLIGVLYLENNLTVGAFTKERMEILNLICCQAAISLENARLYQESQQAFQDLKQAQLQIVQSEKMSALGSLVAGVAHEMNNPLGFISASLAQVKPTFIDLTEHLRLYQKILPNPSEEINDHAEEIDLEYSLKDLPKTLDSMTLACDRLKNISTSLRTFSRADRDYKVAFNIHEGIDSTILILKHRLKANEKRPTIEVITDYGNLPKIQCFPGQLNQVFMNILANAIDALDESNNGKKFADIKTNPNRIIVKTSLGNNQITISIADNGNGIKAEVKTRIFDHLFTTKAVGKGTGLGLAIAQQIIVNKHSGNIEVKSQLGQGTEFIITLPINN